MSGMRRQRYRSSSFRLAKRLEKQIVESGQELIKSHHGRFNRAYADGHVEMEDFNKPLNDSDDYWRRFNIDNQAHRAEWLHAGNIP